MLKYLDLIKANDSKIDSQNLSVYFVEKDVKECIHNLNVRENHLTYITEHICKKSSWKYLSIVHFISYQLKVPKAEHRT